MDLQWEIGPDDDYFLCYKNVWYRLFILHLNDGLPREYWLEDGKDSLQIHTQGGAYTALDMATVYVTCGWLDNPEVTQ